MDKGIVAILLIVLFTSCQPSKKPTPEVLYSVHCGSCHRVPDPASLPRAIWEEKILPEMGARLGMETSYDRLEGWSYEEQAGILKSGAFPPAPALTGQEWESIQAYVLSLAPETLPELVNSSVDSLAGFRARSIQLDDTGRLSLTHIGKPGSDGLLTLGTINGRKILLSAGGSVTTRRYRLPSGIVDADSLNGGSLVTTIGSLVPSELFTGQLFEVSENSVTPLGPTLHRPVYTEVADLDGDGTEEILVCEFGNLNGSLSLLEYENGIWDRRVLLGLPGAIRTRVIDLDGDGDLDIAASFGQGREGIFFLYQEPGMKFRSEQVIELSPVSGTSWFELLDYDADGDPDIIHVQGDNGDKSNIPKPYHGMRLFTNSGDNQFAEEYFYPMYGCSRVSPADFDGDGDLDFALLATFPDYADQGWQHFVLLECLDWDKKEFTARTLEETRNGRWLVMESGDLDGDSDQDILLGAFRFPFNPVPDSLSQRWRENHATDLLILENLLH